MRIPCARHERLQVAGSADVQRKRAPGSALIWGGCSQKHAVLRRAFLGETTTSSEAYMKATRAHGDPHRLSAFFKKLLDGALKQLCA